MLWLLAGQLWDDSNDDYDGFDDPRVSLFFRKEKLSESDDNVDKRRGLFYCLCGQKSQSLPVATRLPRMLLGRRLTGASAVGDDRSWLPFAETRGAFRAFPQPQPIAPLISGFLLWVSSHPKTVCDNSEQIVTVCYLV